MTAEAGTIIALDINSTKDELARRFGATQVIDASAPDAAEQVRRLTGGRGVDAAVECTGHPSAMRLAYEATRPAGKVVIVGISASGGEFTRCRPYRKNDQAHVEQKNGAVVRRIVGYRRLEGLTAAAALGELYRTVRLFVNFFQPSFKLAEKDREGARCTSATTSQRRLISVSCLIRESLMRSNANWSASTPPLIRFGCFATCGRSS
jgi:hypothetical protein